MAPSCFPLGCLPCAGDTPEAPQSLIAEFVTEQPSRYSNELLINEKFAGNSAAPMPYSDDAAAQFIDTLRTANASGPELEARLKSIVSANGWTENLAEAIFRGVVKLITDGAKLAKAMDDAVGKAEHAAWEFAKEHPYYTAIIAIGVLALLAPWVIDALGFGQLGPRAGMLRRTSRGRATMLTCCAASFAARWMSRIAKSEGHVSKGSLYAFLQRLGMTW